MKESTPTLPASNKIQVLDKTLNWKKPVFIIGDKPYNIRILTEKEVFLLMGFSIKDFEKLKGTSRHTIYKVSGNSIVVQVLESILSELLK